jgi:AcrR family transcriptional regulator
VKLAGSVKALWAVAEPGARGPKPALSREQIARMAIRIADAEGLDAVSMQRVADAAGVTPMALYRYFGSKAELVDLMIENAGGPAPGHTARGGWRAALKTWTHQCAAIYRAHPWFLRATAGRRILGPNELAWLESALAILAKAGLDPREQHQACLLLLGHIRSQAEFRAINRDAASARQWAAALRGVLAPSAERYPALLTSLDAGAFQSAPAEDDDFALDCILDGIAAAVRRRS